MKITKAPKRLAEATPEVKSLLARISATPDEGLPEILDQVLEWCWPRGDLHYWTGVLNRFDEILTALCNEYKFADIQSKELPPASKRQLVSILRFSRLLIENCTNRKLYNSYDHLNQLLMTTDLDVLEATLRLLLRPAQQYSSQAVGRGVLPIKHALLATLTLTWSPKDFGLDLAQATKPDVVVPDEACGVRFHFYRRRSITSATAGPSTGAAAQSKPPSSGDRFSGEFSGGSAEAGPSRNALMTPVRSSSATRRADGRPTPVVSTSAASGLVAHSTPARHADTPRTTDAQDSDPFQQEGVVTVKIQDVGATGKDPYTIFSDVVRQHQIPEQYQFELYQKIRVAYFLRSEPARRQMVICRLLALACYSHLVKETAANNELFLYEPDIVQKATAVVEAECGIDHEVQAAAFYALDAMGRFRYKLNTVLSSLSVSTSHGTLLRALRNVIEDVNDPAAAASEHLIDSLFGLIAFVTSTTPGCSMIVGAGLIPLLTQLVDTCKSDVYVVQRTVSRSIGLIDSVVYSFQAAFQAFVDSHGLNVFVNRVESEVELNISNVKVEGKVEDGLGALYGKLTFGRASLLRNLLKTISHMMTNSGGAEGLRGLIESSLLESVKTIMANREVFGPQILALAINIVAAFIHNEPTSLAVIQEKKIPELFFDLVEAGIEGNAEVIAAVPNAIGAICLNEAGLTLFNTRSVIPKIFDMFTSPKHLGVLRDRDNAPMLGSTMDELTRHQPSIKSKVFESLIGVLDRIVEMGKTYQPPEDPNGSYYGLSMVPKSPDSMSTEDDASASQTGPGAPRSLALAEVVMDRGDSSLHEDDGKNEVMGYIDVATNFLDGFFQSVAHCKDFIKAGGPEKLLRCISLPCLPHNFAACRTADSIVSLLRYMDEISPGATLGTILKEVKQGIDEAKSLWTGNADVSSLASLLAPTDEASLAEANEKFRRLTSLNARLNLLADVLPNAPYNGSKAAPVFLQAIHTGITSPQSGQVTLGDLGDLNSIVTWENILFKAYAPIVPVSPQKDGEKRGPQPGLPENVLDDNAGVVEEEAEQAGGSGTQTAADQGGADSGSSSSPVHADPKIRNSAAIRYVMSQLPVALRSILCEVTRLINPKRTWDSPQRRAAAQVADSVGKSMVRQIAPQQSGNETNNLAYATVMIGHLTNVLYEEKSSSVNVQAGVLLAFERAGGLEALFVLYRRFVEQLEQHFEVTGNRSDMDHEASLRLGHLCGGIKVTMNLLQNLSAARPLHESPSTQQLIQNPTPEAFKPHEMLLRVRLALLPPVRDLWERAWLAKVPLSVSRSITQTILHILQGEGEKPPKPKPEPVAAVNGASAADGGNAATGSHRDPLNDFLNLLNPGGSQAFRGGLFSQSSVPRHEVRADEARIQQLTDMGFPRGAARHALVRYHNNANAATEYLLAHPEVVGAMANEPEPELEPEPQQQSPAPAQDPPQPPPTVAPSADAIEGVTTESTSAASLQPAQGEDQAMVVNGEGEADASSNAVVSALLGLSGSGSSGDGDTAMAEARNGTSSSLPSQEPPKTPDSPLKAELDMLRKSLRDTITLRGLELCDAHEQLVFDIKDSVCIFADDEAKTVGTMRMLFEAVHSLSEEAFASKEAPATVRLHFIALLLNEQVIVKYFGEELAQLASNVISSLAAGYQHKVASAKHPTWLAPLLLVASSTFAREEEPTEISQPDKDAEEFPTEPIKKKKRIEAESHKLYELCMCCLNSFDNLSSEEMLAMYRLMVLLTRDAHIASSLTRKGGVLALLKPFHAKVADVSKCQSYLILCLRHIIEAQDLLKETIRQEVSFWFQHARSSALDASTFLRGVSAVALRNPDVFVEVIKEDVEMTDFVSAKGTAVLKLINKETTPQDVTKDGPASDKIADVHDGGPASPTKGAVEADAQMEDLFKRKDKDAKESATANPESDAVIHLLLAELLQTSRERATLWAQRPPSTADDKTSTSIVAESSSQNVAAGAAVAASTDVTAGAAVSEAVDSAGKAKPAKTDQVSTIDSAYSYMCVLMQCLSELLGSYVPCKVSLMNCSKKRFAGVAAGKDVHATPKGKTIPGVMTFLLCELIPLAFLERLSDFEEAKKRTSLARWAMSTILALAADVNVHVSIKDVHQDVITVRKHLLDSIARALRDAATSIEPIELRYGRLYTLSDLCRRLLTSPSTLSGGPATAIKQNEDLTLHIAKTMLEKGFVTILTSALADIDLNMPTVQSLLGAVLSPLDHLTRVAIKTQSKSGEKQAADAAESSEEESDVMSEDDEDEQSDREETPDFYRSSALGMHTGEMGEPEDSMDEDDEEDMEDDEMGEMDYSDEDRSDLSDEDDDDDDSDDSMPHEIVEVIEDDDDTEGDSDDDEESSEDDELEEVEAGDEGSWVDEDSEEGQSGYESDEALDFVLGGGGGGGGEGEEDPVADGDEVQELGFQGMPDILAPGGFDDDDQDTEEDEEESMHDHSQFEEQDLGIFGSGGGASHGQGEMSFGWTMTGGGGDSMPAAGTGPSGPLTLPPSFFVGPPPAETAGGAQRHRLRTTNAAAGDPASHPLLDDERDAANQQAASRRARRAGQNGGYQDWAQSIEELVGGGAAEIFDAIFGRGTGNGQGGDGPPLGLNGDAEIRIELPGGQATRLIGGQNMDRGGHGLRDFISSFTSRHNHHRHQHRSRLPEAAQTSFDVFAAAESFRVMPTLQRWAEEERIIFGELAAECAQRLRHHIANLLMPSWKATAKRNKELRDHLAVVDETRDKLLKELDEIRNELRQTQSEADGLRARALEIQVDQRQGATASTFATASEQSAVSVPQPMVSDVEMPDATPQQQPQRNVSRPALEVDPMQQGSSGTDVSRAPRSDTVPEETATSQSATSEAPPARELFEINGREIDITDLGIDREVLAALPEEMQEEVVSQALRERRAANIPGAEETSISPEFLDALPPELRAEVLEQEAAERAQRRREEQAARDRAQQEATQASQQNESVSNPTPQNAPTQQAPGAAGVPASIIEGALGGGAAPNPFARFYGGRLGANGAGQRRLFGDEGDATADGDTTAASGSLKDKSHRDAIQLLDGNGIAAMIRLLFFPGLNARSSGLHRVLANLSQNAKSRGEILSMLLRILSEGSSDASAVDRSFASMSARAQGGTPGRPTLKRATSVATVGTPGQAQASAATAPLSRAGEEAPHLIAARSIETLLYLTAANDQAALYFLREDARLSKKAKGKEKDRGLAPINVLLHLLEKDSITSNAQVVDSLISLLHTVSKHIPAVAAQVEKERKQREEKEKSAGPNAAGDGSATTEAVAVSAPVDVQSTDSAVTSAPSASAPNEASKEATAPSSAEAALSAPTVMTKLPQVSRESLSAIVRPLGTAISSKAFQSTLAVAAHLAGINSESGHAVTDALQKEAMAATAELSANLDDLLASLPPVAPKDSSRSADESLTLEGTRQPQSYPAADASVSGTGRDRQEDGMAAESLSKKHRIQSSAIPVLASPSGAQARLLRSLRAIDWLHGGR